MGHNFIKFSLHKTLALRNEYYILCLTETFQDSSINNDEDKISILGHNILRVYHPSNTKREDVTIFTRSIFLL